jgi:hypothetical protein
MIHIDKVTAFMLYLCFFLFLYLGAWLISHLKGRRQKGLPPLYQLTTCEYCAYHYLSETGKQITTCPQCHSFNSIDSSL